MSDSQPTVAVVGIGRMGAAMAHRFAEAGYPLVLWNRDRSKAEAIADDTPGSVVNTPADAAAASEIVVTSLADDKALREVYLGTDGIVLGISKGSIALDTSTVDPSTVVEVGEAVDFVGAGFLDCPVSGSVTTVESGALVVMAGGEQELISEVKPLLSTIAKEVVHTGARGSGAACKLAVNGFLHGLNTALSEALVLAEKAGVDRKVAYSVFAGGAAGSPFVQYKREAYESPENATVAFTIDLVAKDLELITGLADRVAAPMPQAKTGLKIVNDAIAAGMGDRDLSAIAVYLREKS